MYFVLRNIYKMLCCLIAKCSKSLCFPVGERVKAIWLSGCKYSNVSVGPRLQYMSSFFKCWFSSMQRSLLSGGEVSKASLLYGCKTAKGSWVSGWRNRSLLCGCTHSKCVPVFGCNISKWSLLPNRKLITNPKAGIILFEK